MRLIVAASTLLSASALGQIQFQQVATGSNAAGTLTVALTAPAAAGHLVMVGIETLPMGQRPQVDDDAGDVYQFDGEVADSNTGTGRVSLLHTIAHGPVSAVTVSVAGGSFIEAFVTEYAGVDGNQPVDSTSASGSTVGPVVEGGPFVTHWPGELVVSLVISEASATSAEPGFVTRSTYAADLWQDEVVGAPGNVLLSNTRSDGGWVSLVTAFRPAGAVDRPTSVMVQQAAQATGGSQMDVVFPQPVTPGGTVVSAIEWSPSSAAVSAQDGLGNPLQPASVVMGPTAGYGTTVLFLPDAGGTAFVHYSVPAGTFIQVVQLEYAGLTAAPLLGESHAQSTTSSTVSSAIDAGAAGLIFSFVMSDSSVVAADPASTTRSNYFRDLVQDRVVQAPGLYALSGADDAGRWNAHQVLFAMNDAGQAPADGGADGGGDAGADGGSDAGAPDGGTGDGGTPDGGRAPPSKLAVGCGCGTGPGGLAYLALLALLGAWRRRSA